jgi:molybdopterin-guanine dinucleotide biosynthesis protein MobB
MILRVHRPPVVEIIGYSGSGKTTLIERLIPYFRKQGLRVAVIKHTSHHHEFDKPGKDSHRLRTVGAEAVFVSSPKMVAMFRDVEAEWPMERMLRHLPRQIDLVIAEGFKNGEYPCLEVFRKAVSANLMSRGREDLLAVVGDDPGDLAVPRFHQDAVGAIGRFIINKLCTQQNKLSALRASFVE